MKQTFFMLGVLAIIIGTSCNKSDDGPTPPPGGGDTTGADTSSDVFVRGVITSDQHWESAKTYHLRGYVYVTNGATITIDAGTQIVSNRDSAGVLVIYRTAKIMAEGSADKPIVFTSAEATPAPGDLGGVIIVGQAKGNNNHSVLEGGVDAAYSVFGGTNDADNSGVLKYVRIEYAGKAVNPGDEVNGLSLYAVGSGTTIDYVEVVRGLDDAFEFFGGTVNCKHLIAYDCADDDFDMDDGFRGMIQFAVSVKDPAFTDNKGTTGDISNNFEVDNVNPSNGFAWTRSPITFPVLSNFTAIGPNNGSGVSADYGYGMRWRRGCRFILANSIVLGGQKAGLDLDDDSTASYYKEDTSRFYNSFLSAVTSTFKVDKQVSATPALDAISLEALVTGRDHSVAYTNSSDVMLSDAFNNAAPNFKPASGSPALTYGTKFDFGKLKDSFFEQVSYVGAFDGSNDWTAGWAVWNK